VIQFIDGPQCFAHILVMRIPINGTILKPEMQVLVINIVSDRPTSDPVSSSTPSNLLKMYRIFFFSFTLPVQFNNQNASA
jgi:hypothetical protein